MNKLKRKTLKMPVRYLMNTVLVVLLFVLLSFMTQNVLSTYQNKVLLTVGINIILAVSLKDVYKRQSGRGPWPASAARRRT